MRRNEGSRSVVGASWLLIVTLFLSNVLGVIRDHYLAQKVPVELLDAYFAAFRIPDLLFNIIILGGITSAFIPIFTDHISLGERKRAWELANGFMNISLLICALISVLLIWLHPLMTPYLVPNFSPSLQDLTTLLGRILLIGPALFAVG